MTDKLELRKQWIEALRSGRYKQGSGRLKSQDGYCCLGVAAEILGEAFVPSSLVSGGYYLTGESEHEMSVSMLPSRVIKAYGLRSSIGGFLNPIGPVDLPSHHIPSLAAMNDTKKTFTEIADYIDKNPEQVFEDYE